MSSLSIYISSGLPISCLLVIEKNQLLFLKLRYLGFLLLAAECIPTLHCYFSNAETKAWKAKWFVKGHISSRKTNKQKKPIHLYFHHMVLICYFIF